MTTTTTAGHADVGARSKRLRAISDALARFGAGIRDGGDIEARYRVLSRMTPSELACLGLTRSDVSRAALTGPGPLSISSQRRGS
jgi:hypothetical protein